jgi:hypothetical protein
MSSYGLTVFVGAFLLFEVQPLMGKYLLPWFGGGPSVWTTCLFFFQTVLLGGYAYAHVLVRYCRPGLQTVIHLGLLAAALASLPIVPSDAWKPRNTGHPSSSILLLLTVNLGLPYFVLASTSPLLQSWSSRLGSGRSPYRLYALSNLGSFLALLSYPVLFEVYLTRKSQAISWEFALVFYSMGCAFCALHALKHGETPSPESDTSRQTNSATAQSFAPHHRLLWVLWPACASVLLLAITNKLCLDMAVFPLLWVLPLSVYLLSFVLCFAGGGWYSRLPSTGLLLSAMTMICWALFQGATWNYWNQVCVYTGSLFVCCVVCHGELFRIRPTPDALTGYYLLVALGGALGSLFVSLIAPAIFTSYYELHWGLALLGVLVVGVRTAEAITVLLPTTQSPSTTISNPRVAPLNWQSRELVRWSLTLLWLACFALNACLWLQSRRSSNAIVHKSRNFYGVLTVFEHRKGETNGHHFLLQHGRITHGFQFVAPELQKWPTTYYGPESGLGLAMKALPARERRVGVVGLGIGTIAAYARPGDYFRFYEINPEVSCLSTSRFTHLTNCEGGCDVTLGDARLSLERQNAQGFDLLALDAFNSDSIPVHLLTLEAFEIYLRHLKPNGILAVHTSNHFLDLEPVVTELARHFGMFSAVVDHDAKPEQWWIYSSTWILMTRDARLLQLPAIHSAIKAASARSKSSPLWTDDFSSLFQILR